MADRDDIISEETRSGFRGLLKGMGEDMLNLLGFELAEEDFGEESDALPDEVSEQLLAQQTKLQQEADELQQWRHRYLHLLTERADRQEANDKFLAKSRERFEQLLEAKPKTKLSETPEMSGQDAIIGMPEEEIAPTEPEPDYREPLPEGSYILPSTENLRLPETTQTAFLDPEELQEQKNKLQDTLDSFAVDALVYDAVVGPRVTQFRIRPGVAVRVESIASLDKNIALALAANSIRVQAPIPGEPYVGIETPNKTALPLTLRTMLESRAWRETQADIPLVLGMDITGQIIVTDLAKAPHMLIAGATGSGKSVCMSNLILSMLYKFSPDELELVLVDPKHVEFSLYKKIPHLIHPVVTDSGQVVAVLHWVVKEMENRYKLLAEKHARNISGYNEKAEAEGFQKLPYLVVVIDELADLMMTARGDVEGCLARIAQLSRAVGIHTIIATQRPSVNVITGTIKANYPTRVAFQVSSQIDSRTILDGKGAEALQGRGDMLFNPPGISKLMRIQAPMVHDEEILHVCEGISEQVPQHFRTHLKQEDQQNLGGDFDDPDEDPMVAEALRIVVESQRASTSYLQRRLRIGYNRAANLIEELEARNYIGPQVGSTPREIYVTTEDL
ncbi:DNA translocase FtsK [Verrucomicrobiota bacterium]